MAERMVLQCLRNFPMIVPGDDLPATIANKLERCGLALEDGDILVIAQKIVSKAQGRFVELEKVEPGPRAKELARATDKDPRLVEVILSESKSIIRSVPGVLITEHKRGWIMANAGIDASNIATIDGSEQVLLLPADPDVTCQRIRTELMALTGFRFGVLINDSFGRPWRLGTTSVALGAAGIASLWDRRAEPDLFGRQMRVTQQGVADQLACAAALLQGEGAEGKPVVLISGYKPQAEIDPPHRPASDLIRNVSEDLFR